MRPSAVRRNPHIRTACDRCYQLKERCHRAAASSCCERCRRLDITCTTNRPFKLVGRRAQSSPRQHGLPNPEASLQQRGIHHSQPLDIYLLSHPDLQPDERELLLFLLKEPGGLGTCVTCPSLQTQQQAVLAAILPDSLPFLKDAYLALAMALLHLQKMAKTDIMTSKSLSHIAKGMEALRTLTVAQAADARLCNALGSVLALSAYATVGVGAPEILRYCLNITETFTEDAILETNEDPWRPFLIFMDTLDSFVHQRKPTCQLLAPSSSIDRHFGLCLSLLPHYHDLSVINSLFSELPQGTRIPFVDMQLDKIHDAVEAWRPSQSHMGQITEQFSTTEVVSLLAQAKAYRLGALLLVHRLRFPFGREDTRAVTWSKELLLELDMAASITKQPLQFVTLPFIIAAVEVKDHSHRNAILLSVDRYVDGFAPMMRDATKTFLERVWEERDLETNHSWFNSIHKPCPVFDSINDTVLNRSSDQLLAPKHILVPP